MSFHSISAADHRQPCPAVICVLHGHSLGLAIDLSSCADIRLCTRTTAFAVKEVDIGIAADIGTLSRLPKIVGSYSWVKEISLTARVFGADEALRVGFVSAVFDDKDAAVAEGLRLSRLIARKSPVAVQGTKELLNYSRDHTVDDGLSRPSLLLSRHPDSDPFRSAIHGCLECSRPTDGGRLDCHASWHTEKDTHF